MYLKPVSCKYAFNRCETFKSQVLDHEFKSRLPPLALPLLAEAAASATSASDAAGQEKRLPHSRMPVLRPLLEVADLLACMLSAVDINPC